LAAQVRLIMEKLSILKSFPYYLRVMQGDTGQSHDLNRSYLNPVA